ncbi:MAG: hypothetical protein Q7J10_02125 [Methanosarcinaceae archaeon]|nr:hypothetical protein [Methanosarcinaceae archaeon]
MSNEISQLEGLSLEDRRKLFAETDVKYKSVVRELQEITQNIDDYAAMMLNSKPGATNSMIKPLMSIVNLQSKLLADIQHLLGKMYTEHSIELHYLNLNLEIMNKNLSVINNSVLNMGKNVHAGDESEDMDL